MVSKADDIRRILQGTPERSMTAGPVMAIFDIAGENQFTNAWLFRKGISCVKFKA
jgi:hypothetical protein